MTPTKTSVPKINSSHHSWLISAAARPLGSKMAGAAAQPVNPQLSKQSIETDDHPGNGCGNGCLTRDVGAVVCAGRNGQSIP